MPDLFVRGLIAIAFAALFILATSLIRLRFFRRSNTDRQPLEAIPSPSTSGKEQEGIPDQAQKRSPSPESQELLEALKGVNAALGNLASNISGLIPSPFI